MAVVDYSKIRWLSLSKPFARRKTLRQAQETAKKIDYLAVDQY